MQNRKQDIIIELGSQNIRVGLVSDKTPRKTISASPIIPYPNNIDEHAYEMRVQELLYTIFYTHINNSINNKTVIILQKVFTDRRIVEAICQVLFRKFKIQKIQFSLSCITPLYLTGKFSGAVISAGFSAVEIMPVYESYPLTQNYKYIPSGTQTMSRVISDELLLLNPQVPNDIFDKITPENLNEWKINYGDMRLVSAKSQDTVTISFKKNKLKFKPASISYSNVFGNPDHECYNIAWMFLSALNEIDLSMLGPIVENVVFSGGLWRVKGMQSYFKKQLKEYLPNFKKLEDWNLAQKIKFVSWGFNPLEVSWVGCSVGSSIRAIDSLCLKKAEYESKGFCEKIMECYFLSG